MQRFLQLLQQQVFMWLMSSALYYICCILIKNGIEISIKYFHVLFIFKHRCRKSSEMCCRGFQISKLLEFGCCIPLDFVMFTMCQELWKDFKLAFIVTIYFYLSLKRLCHDKKLHFDNPVKNSSSFSFATW